MHDADGNVAGLSVDILVEDVGFQAGLVHCESPRHSRRAFGLSRAVLANDLCLVEAVEGLDQSVSAIHWLLGISDTAHRRLDTRFG